MAALCGSHLASISLSSRQFSMSADQDCNPQKFYCFKDSRILKDITYVHTKQVKRAITFPNNLIQSENNNFVDKTAMWTQPLISFDSSSNFEFQLTNEGTTNFTFKYMKKELHIMGAFFFHYFICVT